MPCAVVVGVHADEPAGELVRAHQHPFGVAVASRQAYLAGNPIPHTVAALCTALDKIDRLRAGRLMKAKATAPGSSATDAAPATAAPYQARPATIIGPRSGVRFQL
jgi:hypothetical protein